MFRVMPEPVDLSWFYSLPLDDQVTLLEDPWQELPNDVAVRVKGHLGGVWWSGNATNRLEHSISERLTQIRSSLDDRWWETLSSKDPHNERGLLIAHHLDAEPPESFNRLRPDAATLLGENPAMVTAYIAMKARQSKPDQEQIR